jgi:cytidine deaminase
LSESDSGRWPQRERRAGERRKTVERRAGAKAAKGSSQEERRQSTRRSGKERRDDQPWQPVPLETGLGEELTPQDGVLAAARAAREFAQADYSKFKVGAALETVDGQIISGCNIENATYGLTLCAERVALVKALSEGHSVFTRIAVVADTDAPTPPCGPCRQLLWEYCGDIDVVLGNLSSASSHHRLADLLPLPFDRHLLNR